jgi:aspartyl-tRNA(Asn)/glutamyl-tRNA(Gln) amidotransferase subunit B
MDEKTSYIATIGLEIHAELKTSSKMFCACKNDPDEETPNKNICPICLGHPGTLPVLNKQAITNVLKIGTAVGGTLADFTEWDRKNYFYPDIPKGYQISQYAYPLISGGNIADVDIERIHLEEDTAQSTHDTHENSLINFNRSGVPLMELVTKPVIHDADTATKFAKELQLLLRYLGAGEANMEKGEMRVEANISVATPENTKAGKFGTKTEVKNLNSFKAVSKAISYEIERQIEVLENGEKVVQETRGWDDKNNETYSQRVKESSHDYRYFPDPDIPKLKISEIPEFNISKLQTTIPELPWNKRLRFAKDFNMTEKEVSVFIENPELAVYYESIIANYKSDSKKIKLTTNYLLTDYLALLKGTSNSIETIAPNRFAELINMISKGDLSSRGGKDLLAILLKDPETPLQKIAETNNLIQKSDIGAISAIVAKIISDNANVVSEYKAGKQTSLQFLIGQTMKATKGSANPEIVKELLIRHLG